MRRQLSGSGSATRANPTSQQAETALLQVALLIVRCRDDVEIYELDNEDNLVVGRGLDASMQFVSRSEIIC